MRYSGFVSALMLSLSATVSVAASLPDTGQDKCDNGFNTMVTCSAANSGDNNVYYPRQDGRFGSDAKAAVGTLVKTGAGAAGFDYTKVDNKGNDLPANASVWACTRDNTTGLTWEVKTAAVGFGVYDLHAASNKYLWYNSNGSTNGGNWGCPAGTCEVGVAISCHASGRCRTQLFAEDVNTVGLCGSTADPWRIPTRRELLTLIHAGTPSPNPSIDQNYFPNISSGQWEFWTSTSAVLNTGDAWSVRMISGATASSPKNFDLSVMLVRGQEF